MSRYGNFGLLLQICGLVMGNLPFWDQVSDGFILFLFDSEKLMRFHLQSSNAKTKQKLSFYFGVNNKVFYHTNERFQID